MRSGILLLDKPAGISSAHAIKKIEKRFRLDKVGHGGTLDPFATGLLVVLVGEGTKIARFLLADRKGYEATARVGWETTTVDLEGDKLGDELPPPPESAWRDSRSKFLGKIQQIPPMYSAIKKDGRPLYAYARAGESVELKSREVEIFELELTRWSPTEVEFRAECGGGTYIRTLGADWARASGGRAHLVALRRYRVGDFFVRDAHSLEKLLALPPNEDLPLVSISDALAHLPQIPCSAESTARVRLGDQSALTALTANMAGASSAENALLLDENGRALALISRTADGFKLDRVFR